MKSKVITWFDFTSVAFVAAMAVLLSTMVAVSSAQAMTIGGDAAVGVGAKKQQTDTRVKNFADLQKYWGDYINTQGADEADPYKLSDVKSVTSLYVDPLPQVADEEYTKYVITLKNGDEFSVRQFFAPVEVFHEAIRNTGYTGDIDDLLDLAVSISDKNNHADTDDDEDEDEEEGGLGAALKERLNALQARLWVLLNLNGDDDNDSSNSSVDHDEILERIKHQQPNVPAVSGKPIRVFGCDMNWTRPLRVGDRGQDVMALQKFLNAKGFHVAEQGDGAPGFETDYFGQRTAEALARFQEKYREHVLTPAGLAQGSGYFGTLSQSLFKRLCGEEGDGSDVDPDALLNVRVVGPIATARFNLSGGCQGYEIDWGDGDTDEEEGSDGPVCTMIYRIMSLNHTYDEPGTYDVTLTISGGGADEKTETKEVVIRSMTDRISAKSCTSGDLTFPQGTRASGYTTANGAYTTADSGIFVCMDGEWVEKEFKWDALFNR